MAIMIVAKKKTIFIRRLKMKTCLSIEIVKPLKTMIVVYPAFYISGEHLTRREFFWQPTRYKIRSFENDIWFNPSTCSEDTFNDGDPLLPSHICTVQRGVNDDICTITGSNKS